MARKVGGCFVNVRLAYVFEHKTPGYLEVLQYLSVLKKYKLDDGFIQRKAGAFHI